MTFPLLATTLAGSLPKPSWLAEPEKLWAPGNPEGARSPVREQPENAR